MKILIWLSCVFIYSLIVTGLSTSGIMLGSIPTACLLGCTFFVARMFCKEYDTHKKTTHSKAAPIKSVVTQQEESSVKISLASISNPREANTSKSTSGASTSNPYKKAYTITLIVAACLFLGGTILSLRYYYDILELNQTMADYQENIQQLEADLEAAYDSLKNNEIQFEHSKKNSKKLYIYNYNQGIYTGYWAGYLDAAELKTKSNDIHSLWGSSKQITEKITALYKKYEE